MTDLKWKLYRNGATLGEVGSESGTIVFDESIDDLARITVETKLREIPAAITFGYIGLFVHTCYFPSNVEAMDFVKRLKPALEDISKVADKSDGQELFSAVQKMVDMCG
jgi:hypothetical protein